MRYKYIYEVRAKQEAPSPRTPRSVYVSGALEIDLERREVRSSGKVCLLGARAMEILEVLVKSGGAIVTSDDLMAAIWPGAIVELNTLQVQISAIRGALGPDRGRLKVASGRGYRLLGEWSIQQSVGAPPMYVAPHSLGNSTNLPAPGPPLIGRDADLRQLTAVMAAYRVITLTGPGGIGKTSLALELARNIGIGMPDGVVFVELASLSDAGLVASSVASAIGLKLSDGAIAPTAVAHGIGPRGLLLVLDSCEHVIDAAAEIVETILHNCPNVVILTTTSEILRIDGEYIYRVPALDVPPPDAWQPSGALAHSAVQLFIARVRAGGSNVVFDDSTLPAVAAICRRLDGIPLAIEFAAARAATLGPQLVAARLDDRFRLLTTGRRQALERHQTLRAVLDWSYDLLSPQEQKLLRHLAVFPAGFTLAGAAALIGDATPAHMNTADGVSGLVMKSLVVSEPDRRSGRWHLLDTIRAYAFEKLVDCGEAEAAQYRQACFLRDAFALVMPGSALYPPLREIEAYALEIDNVRPALEWAFSPAGDAAIGVVLTGAYVGVWLHLSLLVECDRWVRVALRHIDDDIGLTPRLRMQMNIALLTALLQGATRKTVTALEQALEMARALDDLDWQLRAVWGLWSYYDNNGEQHAARSWAEVFTDVARRKRDHADLLIADRLLGIALHNAGEQPAAFKHLQRVLCDYEPADHERHRQWFHHDQRLIARLHFSRVLCLIGLLDQAREAAQASFEEASAGGNILTLRYVLGWAVCPVALMTGAFDTADRAIGMLMDIARRHGMRFALLRAQCLQGILLIRRGGYQEGTRLLQAALNEQQKAFSVEAGPEMLGALAEGLGGLGQFDAAFTAVKRGVGRAQTSGALWFSPELHRMRGTLLQQVGAMQAAVDNFEAALVMARSQGALLWELRAGLALAGLHASSNLAPDAFAILAPIYARMTEGHATPDVHQARLILEMLERRMSMTAGLRRS